MIYGHAKPPSMNYATFCQLIAASDAPVVLLEGTRQLPLPAAPLLTALAARLAQSFPKARFRTGNAKGSDEAFAKGVADVDASRLEFVLPHHGHRQRQRPAQSPTTIMGDVTAARVQEVVDATIEASPQYERIAISYRKRAMHPRQRAIAELILRDTLKVTGTPEMPPPVAGIFFVNASEPESGGTGHTVRVCKDRGVPVIDQFAWMGWIEERG